MPLGLKLSNSTWLFYIQVITSTLACSYTRETDVEIVAQQLVSLSRPANLLSRPENSRKKNFGQNSVISTVAP
jgi:hypothetical protein